MKLDTTTKVFIGFATAFAVGAVIYFSINRSMRKKKSPEHGRKWLKPVEGVLTSKYGMRVHPISKVQKFHNGIDIGAPNGTPVKSPDNGTVIQVWSDDVNGNAVRIQHGEGLVSGYAHLSKTSVKTGDKVKRGQIIGNVGSTGSSTGNHLHLTAKKAGQYLDPEKLIT